MGPQHPSTHGVLRLVLELDGETVVSVSPTIGFLHTGIEKTAEQKKWQQVIPLVERMDYLGAQSNSLAYCLSVEKLLGLEVPQRVKDIRVLIAELQRISSHLVWFGTHGMEIGAITGDALRVPRARDHDEPERDAGRVPLLPELHPGRRPARGHPARLQGSGDARSSIGFPGKLDEYETLHHQEPDLARPHPRRRHHHAGRLQRLGAVRADRPRRRRRLRRAPRLPLLGLRDLQVRRHRRQQRRRLRPLHHARRRDARERQDLPPGARAHRAGGRLAGGRPQDRAAAQGRGLHRDGSADSALPDLLAGLQRAGRRRLRAGRRAARRARLLRGVGRLEPAVARAHALARADGQPGAAQVHRRRDDRGRRSR